MPLIDSSHADPLFDALPGPRILYVPNPGWAGDRLIDAGFLQEATRRGCRFVSDDEDCDIVWHGGGFTVSGPWARTDSYDHAWLQARRHNVPAWIVGQSLTEWPTWLDDWQRVFVREETSLAIADNRATLVPDGALLLDPLPADPPRHETLVDLRNDLERGTLAVPTQRVARCQQAEQLLSVVGSFRRVFTNHLHAAIAALLHGRETTLCGGATHKQRSMYDTWLQPLGCKWIDL